MEVKAGYKQTDAGVIPADWSVSRLSALAAVSSGTTPARALRDRYYKDGVIPWVKTMDLTNGEIRSTSECITNLALRETSLTLYPIGTVLVAMYGGFQQIGRTGLLLLPATVNQALSAIQLNTDELVPEYLLATLNHRVSYWRAVASSSRKDPNITGNDVRSFPLAYPDPTEQRAIAAALSDVDALLGGLDRLITKKRDLKQAVMQQLLTGQIRLPGFNGEWEVKRLEHAGRCLRGVSYNPGSDLSTHDTDRTRRLLRANNVQDAVVVTSDVQYVSAARVSSNQILRKNDIVICMANGSKPLVGKAGLFVVDDGYDYTFGAFMGCFRTDATTSDPAFVFSLFQTGRYRDYINNLLAGSSINNLKPSSIESLEFRFPRLSEQAAIAAVLSDMDAELSALEARRDKTRDLKQAMMQELLTGKTRLVPAGAAHA